MTYLRSESGSEVEWSRCATAGIIPEVARRRGGSLALPPRPPARLRRQPHRFQRVALVADGLQPHDSSAAKGEQLEIRVVALDPAGAPLPVLNDAGDHGVANRPQLSRL